VARSAGISLFVCGVLATSLGLGGWRLISQAVQGKHPGAAQSGQGGQPGTGTNGGSAGHGNLAVQASGSARRISPVRPGHHGVARPDWLVIPAIGVSTNLIKLGITAEHTLQVPPTAAIAGWYTKSPRPGELGAAIIAGHGWRAGLRPPRRRPTRPGRPCASGGGLATHGGLFGCTRRPRS